MPLASTFKLATKGGKERWVCPVVDPKVGRVHFEVSATDPGVEPPKLGRGARFRCLVCGQAAGEEHVKAEGTATRIGNRLMAVVAGDRRRVYVSPEDDQETAARVEAPEDMPSEELPQNPRWFSPPAYGLDRQADLFTPRQLVALSTFADLVNEARKRVLADSGDDTYAGAVAVYLAFAVSRLQDYGNSLATWRPKDSAMRSLFAQQAMPMTWDFAEGSPFGRSSSGFTECVEVVAKVIDRLPASTTVTVHQLDATTVVPPTHEALVCSDPPYYDNIGYGDLADFFYVWLRRSLRAVYPDLFSTLLSPKTEELVASPYRFDDGKEGAEAFFEDGLRRTFARMRAIQSPKYPLALFYAFKQAESTNGAVASTGWETMLTGLLESGFSVTGTWPMRTEGDNRTVSIGTAALPRRSCSSAVRGRRTRRSPPGVSSLERCVRSCRRPSSSSSVGTSHPSISRRPPSDLGWPSSLATRRSSRPTGRR